jgi:DNA-binding NtrC family response regulator
MLLEGRNIAVIEDDPIMGESLIQSLSLEGAVAKLFPSGEAAREKILPGATDLVVCDIRLPDTDGQAVFRHFASRADTPPFLFMTAFGDLDQAVELMREGAADYLTKPFDVDVFLQRVRSSMRICPSASSSSVLGISPAMLAVEHLLRLVAPIDSPVLIAGETGTGKEVCAHFLHHISARSGPFMAVNCAAIPSDLLESELFGHEAGAFTGANKRHLGYAERAGNGTLFLDEIGELALPLQAKLLRLLEDRCFHRVGGEKPVAFRARLVSATNADLAALIAAKRFRSDLYYRINVVEVIVPPLRERPEDVPWLMHRLLADINANHGWNKRGIVQPAEQAAMAYAWPGNVRELRNRMERALALSNGGGLSGQDLFPEMRVGAEPTLSAGGSLADVRQAAERQRIVLALAEREGQIGRAAEDLGVSRTTLWEKMKRYGLDDL